MRISAHATRHTKQALFTVPIGHDDDDDDGADVEDDDGDDVKEGGIGIQDPEEARLSRCEWVACLLSRAVLGHSMTGSYTIGLASERLHYTLGERRARAPTTTRSGRISKAPVA